MLTVTQVTGRGDLAFISVAEVSRNSLLLRFAATTESRDSAILAGGRNLFGDEPGAQGEAHRRRDRGPLAGTSVSFFLPNSEFVPPNCTGVTNAQGVATCGGFREQLYVFQSRGYRAEFGGGPVGDIFYWPSKDSVGLFGR